MFGSFELEWDWKIAPKANSGVKYFITEEGKQPLGFEYQMVDDLHWDDRRQVADTIRRLKRALARSTMICSPPHECAHSYPVGEFQSFAYCSFR